MLHITLCTATVTFGRPFTADQKKKKNVYNNMVILSHADCGTEEKSRTYLGHAATRYIIMLYYTYTI